MLINYLFTEPLLFIVLVSAILIALTIHEFAHALIGTQQGDRTALYSHRVSLNPLHHIDPWGFLALLTFGFGWGKPVPYNPYYLRNPRLGTILIALAGPAMNFAGFIVAGLAWRIALVQFALPGDNFLVIFLLFLAAINFMLGVFNLIPIPPLDGSRVLMVIIPERFAFIKDGIERYGQWALIMLLVLSIMNPSILNVLPSFDSIEMLMRKIFLPL